MRKNGFTLIELLAVIVILAIIALIATPIILGIINDAREKANERSVELYASAVRNGIAAQQLRGNEVATGTYKSSDLDFVEYEGDVECDTIDIYEDGGVYVSNCKVNDIPVDYTYGTKQEKGVYLNDVCDPVSVAETGKYTAGDKYTCTVDPNKPAYTFYVLTTPASGVESVNLIMDSNIRTDGEAVKEATPTAEQKGTVAWTSLDYLQEHASQEDIDNSENLNIYGPITALEYLQTATKDWTNVNKQEINNFTDTDGVESQIAIEYTMNARLPHYNEISNVGSSTPWLLDYLENAGNQTNTVSGVYGYWTLSSINLKDWRAWCVYHPGFPYDSNYVYDDTSNGVRPVINLSI